jgi:hypothetical protein
MKISHKNNVDFNIDSNGEVSRRSSWHLMLNEGLAVDSEWLNLRGQAELWAGAVGDAWRLPDADSETYTEDADFIISGITFKALSRYMYEVSYTGHKKHLTAEIIGGISETLNSYSEHSKSATWMVHVDSLTGWLPQIGDVLVWAGDDFLCENINLQERASGEWEVKITAKDMSVMMIGKATFSRNSNHDSIRKAKWRVSIDAYDDFIANSAINSDASSWAGDAYYISDIQVSLNGKIAYYISLEARYAETRLLSVKHSEAFNGYDSDGKINKIVIWTGRWRVHKDNLLDFENRVGESAEDWTISDTIITKVDPVRVTDLIYEVVMEAKELKNSGDNADFNMDDRSKLGQRIDIICKEVDYILGASECGWNKNSQGQFEMIPEWDAQKLCPFVSIIPLPAEMIDANLKCVFVSKTTFLRGRSKAHVRMNLDWSRTPRIVSSVAGVMGSWLKQSFDTEELFDNEGKRWTKIIRSYIHTPADYAWNSNYGGHK